MFYDLLGSTKKIILEFNGIELKKVRYRHCVQFRKFMNVYVYWMSCSHISIGFVKLILSISIGNSEIPFSIGNNHIFHLGIEASNGNSQFEKKNDNSIQLWKIEQTVHDIYYLILAISCMRLLPYVIRCTKWLKLKWHIRNEFKWLAQNTTNDNNHKIIITVSYCKCQNVK